VLIVHLGVVHRKVVALMPSINGAQVSKEIWGRSQAFPSFSIDFGMVVRFLEGTSNKKIAGVPSGYIADCGKA
jgi:hypothetical protein